MSNRLAPTVARFLVKSISAHVRAIPLQIKQNGNEIFALPRILGTNLRFGTTYRSIIKGLGLHDVSRCWQQVVPKRRQLTTHLRCVTSQKTKESFTPRWTPQITPISENVRFILFYFICFVYSLSTPMGRSWIFQPLDQGCTNFPKMQQPIQNSRGQKGDMKRVPYSGPTNIRFHCTNSRRQGDLAQGICVPLP
jgi:hypothetical protein